MFILTFNSGSSSLKFLLCAARAGLAPELRGEIEPFGASAQLTWRRGARHGAQAVDARDAEHAAEHVLALLNDVVRVGEQLLGSIVAVGHRIVHGGGLSSAPVALTPQALHAMSGLSDLAPLHNRSALAVVEVCRRRLQSAPNFATYDTAFFSDLPDYARSYALPAEWVKRFGLRRFGFHGIAHRWLYERCLTLSGCGSSARVITLQLGSGCSVAAIKSGAAVDTSMGFTPLEGLPMATRAGDVDPGIVLHLARCGMTWTELQDGLYRRAGLLGLSSASGDMRELLTLEARGHAGARLAIDAFCYRVRKYIGAYAAALGGVDAIVFGGGVGARAPSIRARICSELGWCGVQLDERINLSSVDTDACISNAGSSPGVYAVSVDEELAIARDVQGFLYGQCPPGISSHE